MKNDIWSEIILNCTIAAAALAAAGYAFCYTYSITAIIGSLIVSTFILCFKKHNISTNIGADFGGGHLLIIPVVVLAVIWFGSLNVASSHSQWPIAAGITVAAVYLKDCIELYKARL